MQKILIDTLTAALEITILVILLMSVVEYLNIGTKGKLINYIKNSKVKQTVVSSILGILPGCGGGFAVVSLYTHSVVTFGALCSAMICSMGDEAFYLIATSPRKYFLLIAILFPLGLAVGLLIGIFSSKTESCKEGL